MRSRNIVLHLWQEAAEPPDVVFSVEDLLKVTDGTRHQVSWNTSLEGVVKAVYSVSHKVTQINIVDAMTHFC